MAQGVVKIFVRREWCGGPLHFAEACRAKRQIVYFESNGRRNPLFLAADQRWDSDPTTLGAVSRRGGRRLSALVEGTAIWAERRRASPKGLLAGGARALLGDDDEALASAPRAAAHSTRDPVHAKGSHRPRELPFRRQWPPPCFGPGPSCWSCSRWSWPTASR